MGHGNAIDKHFEMMEDLILEMRLLRRTIEAHDVSGKTVDTPMTREQAAEYLGVHKDTLYRWAAEEGRIAYSNLGEGARAIMRFHKRDLDEFLRRQRIESVNEARARLRRKCE